MDEIDERGLDMNGTVEQLRERLYEFMKAGTSDAMPDETSSQPEKKMALSQIEIIDRVRKWNVTFDGGKDVFGFLERIDEMVDSYGVPKDRLLPALPLLLRGKALQWYRNNLEDWASWREFVENFKNYFLPPRFHLKLEDEIRNRTQGQEESIREFVAAIQTLMRRFGEISPNHKLERIYQNLKPDYKLFIHRADFRTLTELMKLGEEYEVIRLEQVSFKPPPNPSQSCMPETAYQGPNRGIQNMQVANIETQYNSVDCCWKCGQKGHTRRFCRESAKLFCSQCGKEGILTRNCNCTKQENRNWVPNSRDQSGTLKQRPQ